MENTTFSTLAPALNVELYTQWYELRKNASTMSTNQNLWFADFVPELANHRFSLGKTDFSVLSIGTGEGDNDLLWANKLAQHFSSVYYHAVEPNALHVQLLQERIQKRPFSNVSFSINPVRFETFTTKEKFDLIHFVHCIHLLEDPIASVRHAQTMLDSSGHILVIQQSEEGVPRLHQQFLPSLIGQVERSLSAQQLCERLQNANVPHTVEWLDARLNVTECIQQTETGLSLLSFMMSCDLRGLPSHKLNPLFKELGNMATIGNDGLFWLHEPVGLIKIMA